MAEITETNHITKDGEGELLSTMVRKLIRTKMAIDACTLPLRNFFSFYNLETNFFLIVIYSLKG